MKKTVLSLRRIVKEKVGNLILNQFSLEILSGEIVNLIGLEGSGKEELFSILSGKEEIDSGEIYFLGKEYKKGKDVLPVERVNGIFLIGNYDLIIPDLTVAENIYIIEKINYFQFSVSKRKMEQQTHPLTDRPHIIRKADERHQRQRPHEPRVLKPVRHEIGQRTEIEDDATATQGNTRVAAPLVRTVNDVQTVRHAEIKKFCQEQQN